MNKNIAVIAGDGIGPEIVAQARKVLDRVCEKYGHSFTYTDVLMGGCSIDAYGVPLTDETIEICKASDAVLMGSIGGNAATSPWYKLSPELRPESGLLKLRKSLNLYCNLRPAYLFKELADSCPLAAKEGGRNFDLVICRELTGGLYFGDRYTKETDGVVTAVDTAVYNENEIRRIAVKAFEIAMKRGKKVCSVDKANVLDTSRLWRKVVAEVASMITGSIGMLSSASLSDGSFGLYEPSHGSAPDIAGLGIANPIATILSAAMMLRYSFGLLAEADAIEAAVKQTLADGYRSIDLMPRTGAEGLTSQNCSELGDRICERI